jgi:hypothetical protein
VRMEEVFGAGFTRGEGVDARTCIVCLNIKNLLVTCVVFGARDVTDVTSQNDLILTFASTTLVPHWTPGYLTAIQLGEHVCEQITRSSQLLMLP